MTQRIQIGAIAAIHRYPVKSMQGEDLNAAQVGAHGLQGDRAFALMDPETGKVASAKNPSKWPNLFQFRAAYTEPLLDANRLPAARITFPNGSTALSDDDGIHERLSSTLGKAVRFLTAAPAKAGLEEYWPDIDGLANRDVVTDEAMPAETFFDIGMIHLVTTGTLDSLRKNYPDGRFETRRFRPNLVIRSTPDFGEFPENDWNGRVLSLGDEVKLKITGPCGRCVMTTLPQGDLPKDVGVLKTAVQRNGGHVGSYGEALQAGVLRIGDAVWLEAV